MDSDDSREFQQRKKVPLEMKWEGRKRMKRSLDGRGKVGEVDWLRFGGFRFELLVDEGLRRFCGCRA
jgi:hypothetical protein